MPIVPSFDSLRLRPSAPLLTFSTPVGLFENEALIDVRPAPFMFSVPSFAKLPWPLMLLPSAAASVTTPPSALTSVPLSAITRSRPFAACQVTSPWFSQVRSRCNDVAVGASLTIDPVAVTNWPVPASLPPVQVKGPVARILPAPCSVPPLSVSAALNAEAPPRLRLPSESRKFSKDTSLPAKREPSDSVTSCAPGTSISTVSEASGVCPRLQFAASFQLPVVPTQRLIELSKPSCSCVEL